MLEIRPILALRDNYVYLIRDAATGLAAAVDPSEAAPVLEALHELGWTLSYVLSTHHHWDHTGGNLELRKETGCTIAGARKDAARIPGIGIELEDGDAFALGESTAQVLEIPGHTSGHVAFWFAGSRALFCGDTLFTLGCGRLFEGTPEQMWKSLSRLRALPGETLVHCGHEYTQANARFARTVEPCNRDLAERSARVDAARAQGLPTVPATIDEERRTNPFLRPESPAIRGALGMPGDATDVEVFAELRRRKDRF